MRKILTFLRKLKSNWEIFLPLKKHSSNCKLAIYICRQLFCQWKYPKPSSSYQQCDANEQLACGATKLIHSYSLVKDHQQRTCRLPGHDTRLYSYQLVGDSPQSPAGGLHGCLRQRASPLRLLYVKHIHQYTCTTSNTIHTTYSLTCIWICLLLWWCVNSTKKAWKQNSTTKYCDVSRRVHAFTHNTQVCDGATFRLATISSWAQVVKTLGKPKL